MVCKYIGSHICLLFQSRAGTSIAYLVVALPSHVLTAELLVVLDMLVVLDVFLGRPSALPK